jgi:hypothetical protein
MKIAPLLLLAAAACGSASPRTTGVAMPTGTPIAAPAEPPPPPDIPPGAPASVLDERRRAAQDPTRACRDNDWKTCHWVDVWRRHAVEQLHLPPDWLAANTTIDFIVMNDAPEITSFTIQWTVTIDWVKVPIQEFVVVRSVAGTTFDADDAVLAHYAALEHGGDGYHVFEMKPWTRVVAREVAARALASCHGATPAWDSAGFAEGKHIVMNGSAELPKPDFYHCISAVVDLKTGQLLACGERVCRQD